MTRSGGRANPHQFVSNLVEQRLDNYQAWPANIFKLECEWYGIYQNATGDVLKKLLQDGKIGREPVEIHEQDRPFFTRPDVASEIDEPEVVTGTRRLYEFLTDNGHFADLSTYVALCKVQDEIGNHIQIDVLPEGPRPFLLHNPGRDPDGIVLLPTEYVPVEVYNGRDYLGRNGRKYNQLTDLASTEDDNLNSHPLLINRRSDQDLKASVRKMNGMVVDTDCIVACKTTDPDIEEILEMLNLLPLFHCLPPLEIADGTTLDGEDYIEASRSSDGAEVLRPPSKIAAAANDLPDQYIQRIRGGIQLQYVNSFYRQSADRTRRDACIVLQTIYNQLLREGGRDRQTALNEGWDGARKRYRRLKSADQRRDMILDETRSLLTKLRNERIIVEANGKLHARKATHPQPSLSF